MPLYMFDAAYEPDLAAVKAAGGVAVSHYLTGAYASTSVQPAVALAAGLGVILNYEVGVAELVGASEATGVDVARRALAAIPADCPRDGTVAVYFSIDTEVALSNIGACDAAFRGIRSVLFDLFQVRAYGEGALLSHLADAGLTDGAGWLSESAAFPGFNVASPAVCMVQNHDAAGNWFPSPIPNTDRNLISDPRAIAAWWPVGSPYRIQPNGPHPMEEPTMILLLTTTDAHGAAIPAASQPLCLLAPGQHVHDDAPVLNVLRASLPVQPCNQAQHDQLVVTIGRASVHTDAVAASAAQPSVTVDAGAIVAAIGAKLSAP